MHPTTHSPAVSSKPTKDSEKVSVNQSVQQETPSLSKKHSHIGDLTAIWTKDPERQKALEEARQWLADEFYDESGDTVKTLRLRKGWSQAQLAEAIGSSQSHVARIERGSENLTIQTCRRLCEALGIDMNALDAALLRQEARVGTKAAVRLK